MDVLIPIVTFIVGIVVGFGVGVYYLRKKMMNMNMDSNQIQLMAKRMGLNVNQKQLNQMNKMMQGTNRRK